MPKKASKKQKNPAQEEKKEPPIPEPEEMSPEKKIEAYIGVYIDSYMDYVEELNITEADFPLFYTYYPFDVAGYILPDNSTCFLFRGLSSATSVEIKKADFEEVDSEIKERKFDHICCYPPSHSFTVKEAEKQARADVEKDVDSARLLKREDAETADRDYSLKSVRMLSVVVPWTATRKTEEGGVHISQTDKAKFTPENLKLKEGEDFSAYSERLKSLEGKLYEAKEEEAPSKKEELPPEKEKLEPAPPPPPEVTPAQVTTPGTPTNISIEIKQPDAKGKEAFDEKKELDILRLKKTLYIQTTDIENLKRKSTETERKLGNIEQMRQTVFRMNRKVYDTDARMMQVEKNQREIIAKFAEMKAEQREENKKMRRFITDKAKKARNQALIVAIIALVLAAVSLPFLIMLLLQFWDKIGPMMGF
jgi:hypothetical protein